MARVKVLEIPQLMRDIAAYEDESVTRPALQLIAPTFARTTEMIRMELRAHTGREVHGGHLLSDVSAPI